MCDTLTGTGKSGNYKRRLFNSLSLINPPRRTSSIGTGKSLLHFIAGDRKGRPYATFVFARVDTICYKNNMDEIKTACLRDVIHDYIYFTVPQKSGGVAEETVVDSPWILPGFRGSDASISYRPLGWFIPAPHTQGFSTLSVRCIWRVIWLTGFMTVLKKLFRMNTFRRKKLMLKNFFAWPGFCTMWGTALSAKIIKDQLSSVIEKINFSPHGYFTQKIKAEDVIKFIKTPADFSSYQLWEQIFCKIMLGVYSVDIIDFLLRDKYYCGTREFGDIDTKRLLDSTTITSSGFSMEKEAVPAFKGFLSTRMSMFCHIYFNEKNELFESSFGRLLPGILKLMKIGNPYENIKKYFFLDDFSLISMLNLWAKMEKGQKRELGKQWEKIAVMRETPEKLVLSGQKSYFKFVRREDLLTEEKIISNFRQHYKIKCPVSVNIDTLDVRLQNVFVRFNDKFLLKTEDNLKSISLFLLWQVFVPAKYTRRVQAVIKADSENVSDIGDAQMALPLGPVRWNEKKEKTEITNA